MTFTNKYDIGQCVDYTSYKSQIITKIKTGMITGVFFDNESCSYEIGDEGFVEESNITAVYTRISVIPEQLELPLEFDSRVNLDDEFVSGAV